MWITMKKEFGMNVRRLMSAKHLHNMYAISFIQHRCCRRCRLRRWFYHCPEASNELSKTLEKKKNGIVKQTIWRKWDRMNFKKKYYYGSFFHLSLSLFLTLCDLMVFGFVPFLSPPLSHCKSVFRLPNSVYILHDSWWFTYRWFVANTTCIMWNGWIGIWIYKQTSQLIRTHTHAHTHSNHGKLTA